MRASRVKDVFGDLKSIDFHELISRLHQSNIDFAIWRLPEEDCYRGIIHLSHYPQGWNYRKTENAFVINAYHQQHPVKPLVFSGGVSFECHVQGGQVSFTPSPTLTDAQIKSLEKISAKKPKTTRTEASSTAPLSTDYEVLVEKAVAAITSGKMEKVVLSRYKDYDLPEGFHLGRAFTKVAKAYPGAFCYLLASQDTGTWMGASPERLITVQGHQFTTDALAGTQPLDAGQKLNQVAWTQKEIEEQAMVSRYIVDCFKKIRLREFEEHGPKTVQAGNLAHLRTTFQVDMAATNTPELPEVMLELLHPTSAVCGYPWEAARDFIDAREGYDRELYAGFIGPANYRGATNLYVNLRCMQVFDGHLRLYAGAGITEDSDPRKEYKETAAKMDTLLKALFE